MTPLAPFATHSGASLISSHTLSNSVGLIESDSRKRKLDGDALTTSVTSEVASVGKRVIKTPVSLLQKTTESVCYDKKPTVQTAKADVKASEHSEKKQKMDEIRANNFRFIYDQYTEARGEPKMLEITCRKCHAWVMDYQKDGPGNLLRCYVDRIYHPSALRHKTFTQSTLRDVEKLCCFDCQAILAEPFIYRRQLPKPETRPAYRILNQRDTSTGRFTPTIILTERKKS